MPNVFLYFKKISKTYLIFASVVFLFFILQKDAYAATNFSLQPGATIECSQQGAYYGSNSCQPLIDGKENTRQSMGINTIWSYPLDVWYQFPNEWSGACYVWGCAAGTPLTYQATVHFKSPVNIKRVELVYDYVADHCVNTCGIDLFYGDTWHKVLDVPMNSVTDPAIFYKQIASTTIFQNGSWPDTTDMRVQVGFVPQYVSLGYPDIVHWIPPRAYFYSGRFAVYEFRALDSIPEPPCNDIGLRTYNGTSVVKIDAEATSTVTSPLRIAKNGIVYGIKLVEPSDPTASSLKIMTASGIKSLKTCQ